jgi:hypothetical protein
LRIWIRAIPAKRLVRLHKAAASNGGGKHTEAIRGFVLLPGRRVAERRFARAARLRRLARGDERLSHTLAGFHVLAFACLMRPKIIDFIHMGS